MQKVSKIVFFGDSPFNGSQFKYLGIEILINSGFEVLIYDFSPLIYPKLYEAGVSDDPIEYQKHFCFVNKSDAIKAIRELGSDTFVICLMPYNSERTFWIYRTLSKTRAPYAVLVTNAIPARNTNGGIKRFLNNFLNKISRLSYIKIRKKIRSITYRVVFLCNLGIRAADLVIAGGAESVRNYRRSFPFGKKTEILWTHTLDYDILLEMRCKSSAKNANAVFIDAGVFYQVGDGLTLLEGHPALTSNKEKYRASLHNFFNKVEIETGCIVNIAAHPGYAGCSHPDEFGKRLTIAGKTAEMISQSNFVITHGSTAVSFAVILGKPIIFITTDELLAITEHAVGIENMASWFGKTLINIDHSFDINWDNELLIDNGYYSNYKNSFIKKKGSQEINSWQIVANRLKCM